MDVSILTNKREFLTILRDKYQKYLFEDFLPYMESYIIDAEHGGFTCNTDRNGEAVSSVKRTWYDGRGIWVYSFLYQHFQREGKYLEVARKTIELVLKVKPEDKSFWPESYTCDGVALSDKPGDIYGGLFVAEGFVAYAKASNDRSFLDRAKAILFDAVKQYDAEEYHYIPHYQSAKVQIKGPRVLGHWMVLLNISRQILDHDEDKKVSDIYDRSVDALFGYHLQSDFGLMIEYLNHDLSTPNNILSQFCYIGHAIEVLWMIMSEAERRKDQDLFLKSTQLFQRHLEVAWDDVYGGFFHCLNNVSRNEWLLDKVLWVQEESMIGLMILMENGESQWAKRWISRVWGYLERTFILSDHSARLWINGGDRQLNTHHQVQRMENYHHPRHLMLNLIRLNRMI